VAGGWAAWCRGVGGAVGIESDAKLKVGILYLQNYLSLPWGEKNLERKSSILLTGMEHNGMEQNCTAANFKRLSSCPVMSCGERYINIHNWIIVFDNMITLENSDACLS
jgi:hypothetical protein